MFCAYTRPRYQVSVYRTIGPLVQACINKMGLCLFYDYTRADQLLPQLLIELFDTLYTQCKHIEHMHEGVWFIRTYY